MRPRIAVLVPAHNNARTIAHTIRSVTDQARVRELSAVMLADDASADDTVLRAHAAAGGALRLTLLPAAQNQGPWQNLNRALRQLARSNDWAVILHADDIATEGWLDALLTRIGRCGADVASISTSWDMLYGQRVDRTGERHDDEVRRIAASHEAVRDTLLNGCWWKISGAAVRLRAFLEIGDFDARVHQCADWDWIMRALARGWGFEYIPRVHTIYRQHGTTMSTGSLRNDVDILDAITLLDRFGHTLRKREVLAYHARRASYTLRRLARGVVQRDGQRVRTSFHTISWLSRHLLKQLAA